MTALQHKVCVEVNGVAFERHVPARLTLADFLRQELRLTGTHIGCEHGVCGACTVLLDGHSIRSCLILAIQVHGKAVRTIEGVSDHEELSPIQQALIRHHGLQCGFCTPGVVMTLTELLSSEATISEDDVRVALSGNLCRCTGYQGMVDAALEVAALPLEQRR